MIHPDWESQSTRDLFGRFLHLALSNNLDLQTVLSYPLTSAPASLPHIDGTMNKTGKAALQQKLEKMIDSCSPTSVNAYVIDAMFLIRSWTNLPSTYAGVAKAILSQICCFAKRVDFVRDTYIVTKAQG